MSSWVLPLEQELAPARTRPVSGQAHVAIHGLEKRYAGQQVAALTDIELTINRGEIFGIIGRSGAGKSSLIRCLNRLERPSAGTVAVDGVDIGALDERALVAWRRRTGMIFQHFNLLSAKTVRENIELPLKVAGVGRTERTRKVDELLALVGLTEYQHAWPARLSGGQRQRVGIARALVHDPELLLCDEATSALDPETTRSILGLLKRINQQRGITIVLITHEMDVVHDICHQVAVLERGRIIERGPVWQVFGAPREEVTRLLLNPDHDSVPEDIAPYLSADPSAGARALLRLRYRGDGAQPDIGKISARWQGATLLKSEIEWLQGRPVGQMLLLLADDAIEDNGAEPHGVADSVEVAGYVAG